MPIASGENTPPDPLETLCDESIPLIRDKYTALVKFKYATHFQEERLPILPEKVAKEVLFMKAVDAKYDLWSQEPEPIVLWDLDETIGAQYRDGSTGKYSWHFRPGFFPLADYLTKTYPTVRNGILSTASSGYLQQIYTQDGGDRLPSSFFVPALEHYVGNQIARGINYDKLEEEIKKRTGLDYVPLSEGDALKIKVIQSLQAQGHNVKWIDDNFGVHYLGTSGLFVKEYDPRI